MEKQTSFSAGEYLAVGAIVESFFKSVQPEKVPQLQVYVGAVATGKTTLRRKLPLNTYVHFDFGEICMALERVFGKQHPRLDEYMMLGNEIVFMDTICNKRNIAIEVTGENMAPLLQTISNMKEIGYESHINYVECDIAEAYRRHLDASKNDPEYFSAHYSEEGTLSPFLRHNLQALVAEATDG